MDNYLKRKIEEDEKWIYEHFHSPKAIFFNIITLGAYKLAQTTNYMRRIGLL